MHRSQLEAICETVLQDLERVYKMPNSLKNSKEGQEFLMKSIAMTALLTEEMLLNPEFEGPYEGS